jgi:hypothetical protein
MKTKTINLYDYDELSEDAKLKALDWYASCAMHDEWWESVYEDAARIGLKITGFDSDRGSIKGVLMESAVKVSMYILDGHSKESDTYQTAERYRNVLAEIGAQEDACDGEYDDADEDFEYELLQDYLSLLRKELDYVQSREYCEESIRANEYTFTVDGKRMD